MKQLLFPVALLLTGTAFAQTNTFPANGNVGINTTSPAGSLDINANGNIPIIRGNGGYIPSGLRFVDDSYTQAGQVQEWAIWKGNTWLKGLGFMRYDAVNRCAGGICDLSMFLADNGKVGINTGNPTRQLTVNGDIYGMGLSSLSFQSDARFTVTSSNVPSISLASVSVPQYGMITPNTSSSAETWISGHGGIRFFTDGNPVPQVSVMNGNLGLGILTPTVKLDVAGSQKVSGKVGIGGVTTFPTMAGTANVSTYNLFVKGGILTDEIRVAAGNTWADYVFADDYQLKPLSEVETYIEENKHLPDVPSAGEVKTDGINIAEMARIQQEKIEELTLYIIQQDKRIKALEAKLSAQ